MEDAVRLKKFYDERIVPKMSQTQFGISFDIGSPSMVWQYLSGHRPLNIRAAVSFAKGLDCKIEEFSPSIANEIADAMKHARLPPSIEDAGDTEIHRLSRAEVHIVTRFRLTDEAGQVDILDRVNTVPVRERAERKLEEVPLRKRKGGGKEQAS